MDDSRELFESVIPHAWLPDETLFSLCSRHHLLSGNHLASTTCKQLFGHPTQGAAHDLPSRIAQFVARTRAQLGAADEIIYRRTILPFYLPFSAPATASLARSAMSGAGIASLKFKLGLLTSRFRANHPLKACMVCMEKDRSGWQTAYWHRNHQIPGVWVCPDHRVPLAISPLKSTGVGRFHWLLPAASHVVCRKDMGDVPEPVIALANTAIGLATLPPNTHFDSGQVAKAYRNALRERDLLKGRNNNRLHLREVGRQYARYVEPLRDIEELKALPATEEEAAMEVAKLAREPQRRSHPLRHLAVIGWLYGDMKSFVSSYDALGEISSPMERASVAAKSSEPENLPELRQRLLDLVASGRSPTGAARQIGVDPVTGMAWAASEGFPTAKRPSVIKNDVRKKMIRALKHGAAKIVAANIGVVSVQSITRLLRTEVGLHDAWREARFANAQRAARRKWLRVIATNPLSGVKAARMLEPAAYGWLYRWDRDWLNAQTELVNRVKRPGGTTIDWDARDQYLAKEVAVAGLEQANAMPGSRIKLWQLYQRIPELKAKLSALDRLPLTRNAIQRVLRANAGEPTLIPASHRSPPDNNLVMP